MAGSIAVDPNPILKPAPALLTATVSDIYTGNADVVSAEWSAGPTAAPAGSGTAMNGSFTSPLVTVSAVVNSDTLTAGSDALWVRGKDAAGQWGNAAGLVVVVLVLGPGAVPNDHRLPERFAGARTFA